MGGVGVVAPGLRAQDTTQARPDTSKPAQDTGRAEPSPAPPGAAAQQEPGGTTHVVVQGETLWSIAQQYFNDPLLWPEIYRLNTNVVEDPHWIYPGEALNLASVLGVARAPESADTTAVSPPQIAGADTVRADTALVVEAPPPPSNEPTAGYQTIFERRRTRTDQERDVLRSYADQPYRPVRRGEFYSAGFLTENERLPYGRVLGNTAVPAIPRLSERTTAITFDQIAIAPPRSASYHVGDSLLIVRIDRDIARWGGVVMPLGVARVSEVQRKQVLAELIMQFARVRNGDLSLPLEPFTDPGRVRPTPVVQGLEGIVIAQRDYHVLAAPRQIIFVNRGRADGVVPGDVFEVYRPASGALGTGSEQVRVVLEIVHTRGHSASGLVLNVNHPDIFPGMPTRLVRKMPS